METKDYLLRFGLFYVLAVLFGMCISWKYCGCELMCVSFYYIARALWHEITHD